MRKEGKEMGFSSKGIETRERKKKPEEEAKEQKRFEEVFSHIETRVDLKRSQIEQQKAVERLGKREDKPFEVNEKAVVLALNLGEALGKNPKALDRW
jgi:hypothetical protein